MLKLVGKILAYLHWPLLAWVIYHHYFIWAEHDDRVAEIKRDVVAAKKKAKKLVVKKDQMQDFLANVEAAKDRVKQVTKQVQKLQKQLPMEVSDTENLHILSTMAKELNLQNIFLAPKKEKLHGFYYSRIYEFKARGTFLQFLIMLEGISKTTRVFNIRDVEFARDKKKKNRGRFQLIDGKMAIEAYRQNPRYREDSGIEAIEKKYSAKSKKKKSKKRKKSSRKKNKKKKRRKR